jgi:hypothetical protein
MLCMVGIYVYMAFLEGHTRFSLIFLNWGGVGYHRIVSCSGFLRLDLGRVDLGS